MHWEQNKSRALNYAGHDEAELEKALKESMKTWNDESSSRPGEEGGMVGQVINPGAGKEPEKPNFEAF